MSIFYYHEPELIYWINTGPALIAVWSFDNRQCHRVRFAVFLTLMLLVAYFGQYKMMQKNLKNE